MHKVPLLIPVHLIATHKRGMWNWNETWNCRVFEKKEAKKEEAGRYTHRGRFPGLNQCRKSWKPSNNWALIHSTHERWSQVESLFAICYLPSSKKMSAVNVISMNTPFLWLCLGFPCVGGLSILTETQSNINLSLQCLFEDDAAKHRRSLPLLLWIYPNIVL